MQNPKYMLAGIAVLMLTIRPAVAQSSANANPLPAAKADPQITAALRDVSAQRIEQNIVKLVSFYTRQTLSSDMPASSGRGATAAADWIKSEFEQYSQGLRRLPGGEDRRVHPGAGTAGSAADEDHQRLCRTERNRCRERRAHRAGYRPLRFAQQRYSRCRPARLPAPTTTAAALP